MMETTDKLASLQGDAKDEKIKSITGVYKALIAERDAIVLSDGFGCYDEWSHPNGMGFSWHHPELMGKIRATELALACLGVDWKKLQ